MNSKQGCNNIYIYISQTHTKPSTTKGKTTQKDKLAALDH